MSGLSERIVILAADQLPEPERTRRREEWSADLEGTAETGLSRWGVAWGAITFAIGAPVANPLAADRWARWALAFAAVGPVAWLSMRTSGLFMSNPPLRDALEPVIIVAAAITIVLVVASGLRARGLPWAASGSAILLLVSGTLWVAGAPTESRFAPLGIAAMGVAAAGLVGTALAWGRRAPASRGHGRALLAAAALPALALAYPLGAQFVAWVPVAVAVIAMAIVGITAVRLSPTRLRRSAAVAAASRTLIVVAATSVALAVAVLISTIVWPRPTMAPRAWESLVVWPAVFQTIAAAAVAVAVVVAFQGLAALDRRRERGSAVVPIGFLVAAALAGATSTFPSLAPWDVQVSLVMSSVIAACACVLAVVGFSALVAPIAGSSLASSTFQR